jgi:hypothetical protein
VPFGGVVRLSGHSLRSCHLLNPNSALAFVLKNPRISYGERLLVDFQSQVFFLRFSYPKKILVEFSKGVLAKIIKLKLINYSDAFCIQSQTEAEVFPPKINQWLFSSRTKLSQEKC